MRVIKSSSGYLVKVNESFFLVCQKKKTEKCFQTNKKIRLLMWNSSAGQLKFQKTEKTNKPKMSQKAVLIVTVVIVLTMMTREAEAKRKSEPT